MEIGKKIMFGESVINSLMGQKETQIGMPTEYCEYAHSGKFTDGILLCESHDTTMLYLAREADRVQEELEGKVSDIEMFAEATFGEKGFFKGVWDFVIKCFTAVVDWVKSIFGKFVKVTEKTVKELDKVTNELIVKAKKIDMSKLATTESAKVVFFQVDNLAEPKIGNFIAHQTLQLGIGTLWEVSALKGYKFAGRTAKDLFETDIQTTLTAAVRTGAGAGGTGMDAANTNVSNAVKDIRDKSNETGGFGTEGKEKKLKYFLNGLLSEGEKNPFAKVGAFRLTINDSDEKGKMSAKEEFTKVFFDYTEKTYNGAEVKTFITAISNMATYVSENPLKEMSGVKNKLSEGVKYFENIKKEYEKIASNFTSAAKSMRSSTAEGNKEARDNANSMGGFIDDVSKLSSWYTSNVINTYAIADLCIGKSAANLIGAFNLGINTIDNVGTVK